MALLIRLVLLAAGAVAGLLVAPQAPNFGVIQGMTALLLIAAVVGVLAFFLAEIEAGISHSFVSMCDAPRWTEVLLA